MVIFAEAATRVDHEFSTAVVKMKPQETFAAEKVGVEDLIEARDAGDLGDLLADCGLKAGERARLKRELAKLRPVL